MPPPTPSKVPTLVNVIKYTWSKALPPGHHFPCPSIHYHQVQYLRNWNCATEQRPRPPNTFYGRPDTFSLSINHCMLIPRLILSPEPLSPSSHTCHPFIYLPVNNNPLCWQIVLFSLSWYNCSSLGLPFTYKTVSGISSELNGFFRWDETRQDTHNLPCGYPQLNYCSPPQDALDSPSSKPWPPARDHCQISCTCCKVNIFVRNCFFNLHHLMVCLCFPITCWINHFLDFSSSVDLHNR